MKKAFLIVAAVAGYSLIETALLLGITVSSPRDRFPSLHQQVIAFGQLLLLPGLVALISRIMFGPSQWLRRTLMILLAGILGVPIAILLFVLVILLIVWAADRGTWLLAIVCPVILIGVVWALLFLITKSGNWGVQAEATRWLAERQSGTSAHDRRWRTRGIRIAVCIPILLTLPIFLFLPETWGMASHVRWPRAGMLAGYRFRVPATWYIFYNYSDADGRSSAYGIAGRGIGFGGNPFDLDSLSSWSVGTKSVDGNERTDYDRWPPKPDEIFGQRVIKIGGGTLTCVDYLPSYGGWAPPRSHAATIAHVDCSGVGRLYANFDGPRYQLNEFYRVLDGISEVK